MSENRKINEKDGKYGEKGEEEKYWDGRWDWFKLKWLYGNWKKKRNKGRSRGRN